MTRDNLQRRRGPRLRGLALLSAGGLLIGLTIPAQAQIATPEECARMPSQADELSCLRKALEQSRAALAGGSKAGGQAAAPAGSERQAIARPAAPPPVEQLGAEQLAVQWQPTPKRPKAEKARPEPKPIPERLRALVAGVDTDPLGIVTLRLDNGQVWRQAESTGVPLSLEESRKYPVEIARSGFGGYRLRFTDMGRQIVVKRLQ